MTEIRYRPGKWFGIVSEHGVALLPDVLDEDAVKQVWSSFSEGRGLAGVLETLTSAFGVGLMSLPPFAVVALEGELARVAVRGDLLVTVVEELDEAAPPSILSGEGVTTWSERMITAPVSISVRQKAGRRGSALSLPISSGVVLCSQLTSTYRGAIVEAGPIEAEIESDEALFLEPEASLPTPALPPVAPEQPAVVEAVPAPLPESDPEPEPVVAAEPVQPAPITPPAPPLATVTAPAIDSDLDEWGYPRAAPSLPEPAVPEPAVTPDPIVTPEPAADPTRQLESTITPDLTRLPSETVRSADDEYDHLFGETVARVVEDAAVRVTEEDAAPAPAGPGGLIGGVPDFAPSASPAPATEPGDHDGHTISIAELRALQGASPVVAVAAERQRPDPIARLELSTGDVIELDRPVVIGRRPATGRASAHELPQLVTVPSPMQDISRSHLDVRAEGIHVVVRDLATVNGTVLRRIGQAPVRLNASEPVVVIGGDVLDLGDGVTVTIRELV